MAYTNHTRTTLASALALALAVTSGTVFAQQAPAAPAQPEPPRPPAPPATEAARDGQHHRVRVVTRTDAEAAQRYAEALRAAELEQQAALEAVAEARRELQVRAEEERAQAMEAERRAESAMASAERSREAGEARREAEVARREAERAQARAEERTLRAVRRELEKAHENLRRASREVAQVHRQLNQSAPFPQAAPSFGGNRAVIGVILGDNTVEGVRVLGLTPGGPAERAGIRQGDVIVSLMDEKLVEDGGDGRAVLSAAMEAVEAGDELSITVKRDGETRTLGLVAEERTPFSWQSVTRLGTPLAPDAPLPPDAPVIVQSFEMPNIDREQLEREIEALHETLDTRQIIIDFEGDQGQSFIQEFESLSELGGVALAGTNIWFGMPLTRGLELAELNSGLGAYFDTDEGVLVLKARDDNDLQLQPGDVILSVNGERVARPADVMRALRSAEVGETIDLDIMRDRAARTLTIEIPEQRLGLRFNAWPGELEYRFKSGD